MKNLKLIIFDLDGTLYNFDKGKSKDFGSSQFYSDIKKNAYAFFSKKLNLDLEQAQLEFIRIKSKYSGEISMGVEKEFNINRYEYFENTWNLDPSNYLIKNNGLRPLIQKLEGKLAVLTAAPRVWAESALKYLNIYDLFDKNIFTGEPDIRKPDPLAFKIICDELGFYPMKTISVGDQLSSDILPAKSLGMKTVLVGSLSNEADVCIESIDQINEAIGKIENEKNNN